MQALAVVAFLEYSGELKTPALVVMLAPSPAHQ